MPNFSIPPELPEPDAGGLSALCATQNELDELGYLNRYLRGARDEVHKFRASIALADLAFNNLFDTSLPFTSRHIFMSWAAISANSSLNALYQFKEILDSMQKWADKSAVSRCFNNANAAGDTIALLHEKFPGFIAARHATAHAGKISADREENFYIGGLKHGIIKINPGNELLMQDCFEDRTFVTTRKGAILRFDVDWNSYYNLLSAYEALLQHVRPIQPQV